MSSAPPPGYEQMPQWMADFLDPMSEEAKALVKRAFDMTLEEAKKQGEADPNGCAIGAVIGICAQMGLQATACAIDARPGIHPVSAANQMAIEIRNSTLLTFADMLKVLNEAATAVKS
jgi:hypothetical protein